MKMYRPVRRDNRYNMRAVFAADPISLISSW